MFTVGDTVKFTTSMGGLSRQLKVTHVGTKWVRLQTTGYKPRPFGRCDKRTGNIDGHGKCEVIESTVDSEG